VESLDFGTDVSSQLEFVDLQYNEITVYKPSANKVLQVMYVSFSLIKNDLFVSINCLSVDISTDWQIIQCV